MNLPFSMIPLASLSSGFFTPKKQDLRHNEEPFAADRRRMVNTQIRARNIQDPNVLNALLKVPRHRFIPPNLREFTYGDHPLAIGYQQTISQPYIVAYMTAIAEISPTDKVLEIGTGCGYQTAILGEIAQEVYTVELIPELAKKARQTLHELGYQNLHFKIGDGYAGWSEYAPYDIILVTAAPDHVPQPLIDQLASNGRMVIPVGNWQQYIEVLQKKSGQVLKRRTICVQFVPLCRSSSTPKVSDF